MSIEELDTRMEVIFLVQRIVQLSVSSVIVRLFRTRLATCSISLSFVRSLADHGQSSSSAVGSLLWRQCSHPAAPAQHRRHDRLDAQDRFAKHLQLRPADDQKHDLLAFVGQQIQRQGQSAFFLSCFLLF
jgi:hypothetical protein